MTYEPTKLELAFCAFGYIGAAILAVVLAAKALQLAARAVVRVCDEVADRRERVIARNERLAEIHRDQDIEDELQEIVRQEHDRDAPIDRPWL